jgi:hypothetical protein
VQQDCQTAWPETLSEIENCLRIYCREVTLVPFTATLSRACWGTPKACGKSFGFVLARLAGRYFLDVKMPGALPVSVSAFVLMAVAVVASVLPAARAARVDIMEALRSE